MKIPSHLHHKIEAEKVCLMLLGDLSEPEAERRAIAKVKAEEAANKPKPQSATSTLPNKVSQPAVDVETKKAADEFRRMMMQDFDISLIEDLHTYTDEMLAELLERDGLI